MTMLEVKGLAKVYRAGTFGNDFQAALRGVSFSMDRGEVVSLIGQSGSGKSTLGKILLRLTEPSAGKVTFEGRDITTWGKAARRDYYRQVQGVFQDPFSSYNPLYKADRVFEMVRGVYFPDLGPAQWSAKVERALEAVSLNPADVLNKFPHQLSGGQQQRLLIARALLLEVKMLIADEIISMLDASTRVDVLNLLVGLKRQGLGVLFITHDLSLGNYISDKTVILRSGAIVEMGTTQLVFGNPQHPYTKALLTAVPQLHKKWEPGLGLGGPDEGASEGTPASLEGVPAAARYASGSSDLARSPEVARSSQLGGVASDAVGPPGHPGAPNPAEVDQPEAPRRYSKSPVHPRHWAGAAADQRERGRLSLMDRADHPWHRRFAFGKPDYAAVLAANPAPTMFEVEPGHLVAEGG